MPLIEADEDEVKAGAAARRLLDSFYTNPKTRSKLLGLVKDLNPDAPIPELDVAAPLQAQLEEFRKEIGGTVAELKDALTKDKQARDVTSVIERERSKLRKMGYDDEGIAGIEKVMEDRGVVDYDMAAAYYDKTLPKPEPINDSYGMDRSWNFNAPRDDDADHKGWLENPRKQSQLEIRKFLSEQRAARGR